MSTYVTYPVFFTVLFLIGLSSCEQSTKGVPDAQDEASQLQLKSKLRDALSTATSYAVGNSKEPLHEDSMVRKIYEGNGFAALWMVNGKPSVAGDSLFHFLTQSKYYGLYTSDYHFPLLQGMIDSLHHDSLIRGNSDFVSATDMLLTDAALHMSRHLMIGRIPLDSLTIRKDTNLSFSLFQGVINGLTRAGSFASTIRDMEPRHKDYLALKDALRQFLDSIGELKSYAVIKYNQSNPKLMRELVSNRLREEKLIDASVPAGDTASLRLAILTYQQKNGLKETGQINEATVKKLNTHPLEAFKVIAINLDRYKHLPDSMPSKYLWVNIPAFYMKVFDSDTLAVMSKVVVGKASTPTPQLNSTITDMVTYPQWNIPSSILQKEVFPNMKKNPGYLAKKGYRLVSNKGQSVNPDSIKWESYTNGIPFRVVQPSGDFNALGVVKFNFKNKFNVYLHDTNQRSLFKNEFRSLSHGCVRVQDWRELADYLLLVDSLTHAGTGTKITSSDSLSTMLQRKEHRTISIRNTLPIFIRYFSCEAENGRVKFYADIYGIDSRLKEKLFNGKSVR